MKDNGFHMLSVFSVVSSYAEPKKVGKRFQKCSRPTFTLTDSLYIRKMLVNIKNNSNRIALFSKLNIRGFFRILNLIN